MVLAPCEDDDVENEGSPAFRNEVLARYRQLREISKRHHDEILKFISSDTLLYHARRLGLAQGKTLILDNVDELNYAFDLAIHTAAAGRSRAIDRYARSARLAAQSDEAHVLDAMRAARFSILVIERRHAAAGLVATDLLRPAKLWLVDIGLEGSMPEGGMIATRFYAPDRFSMTAGVFVPLDLGIIEEIDGELPGRLREDDRRFAEAIYRIALADGITDRVSYQELPDDAQLGNASQPA
jgi:hypothetical protein